MRILTCYNNIMHPGIAKLVSRLVWDQETVRSSRTTRTKMCRQKRYTAEIPHESAVFLRFLEK